MNNNKDSLQLQLRLTKLLGKSSFTQTKKACTGKYRGSYDYSLTFEDGSRFYISTGKTLYLSRLEEAVAHYQYYRDHYEELVCLTQQVIERDNRQAEEMGLMPVSFEELKLFEEKRTDHEFWIGLRLKQNGVEFTHFNTNFFYACMGNSFAEKGLEHYFANLLNRPFEKLPTAYTCEKEKCTKILLGYLYL